MDFVRHAGVALDGFVREIYALDAFSIYSQSIVADSDNLDTATAGDHGPSEDDTPKTQPKPATKAKVLQTPTAARQDFADILEQAVANERFRGQLEERVLATQAVVESTVDEYNQIRLFRNSLERRMIPGLEAELVDANRIIREYEFALEQGCAIDGREMTCGLNEYHAEGEAKLRATLANHSYLFGRLQRAAQNFVDASVHTGSAGGLVADHHFFIKLIIVMESRRALQQAREEVSAASRAFQDSAASFRRLDAGAIGGNQGAPGARAHRDGLRTEFLALKRHADILKANQQRAESRFLYDVAYPVLVTAGRLPPDTRSSLPPTPTSLSRLERGNPRPEKWAEQASANRADDPERVAAVEAWLRDWRVTRTELWACQEQLREARENHSKGLAQHLTTYTNGTVETFEAFYRRQTGQSFQERERRFVTFVAEAQADYDQSRDGARRFGQQFNFDDFPLSPTRLADQAEDGHVSCAGTGFLARRRLSATKKEPDILRWSRTVARGLSPTSAQSSPVLTSGSPSQGRETSLPPDERPSRELMERLRARADALRPVAEGLRRDAWVGRLRDTRARRMQGRARRPSIQWHQTHPAQSDGEALRDREAQERAVRAGRRQAESVRGRRELNRSEIYVTKSKLIKW
ncbi:hypothetical protein LTR36_008936 [Oleoguttula mirabilis]|uniref:Uncharacterized protein n=1 Tax=Oleoguttula mirabilis TaxID=1507867 RepID=A0AAV9J6T4_9PEZI|nr:hypothetical protein LTR36_008936 [Oleoguttula mirabilis]